MDKASHGAFTTCLRKVANALKIECPQDLPTPPDARTRRDLWDGKLTSRYASNAGKMYDSLLRTIERKDFTHQPVRPSPDDISSAKKTLGTKHQFIELARQQFETASKRRNVAGTAAKTIAGTVAAFPPPLSTTHAIQAGTLHAPDKTSPQPPDYILLSEFLAGFGLREFMGSDDDWRKTVRRAKEWLLMNPEDFYCRGMLFWSVLRKGAPSEMIAVLNEMAQWLASDLPAAVNLGAEGATRIWQQIIDETIGLLANETVEMPDFVRWHLEDTLVRATMLRYLRYQGKQVLAKSEFAKLGRDLEQQFIMRVLFASEKSFGGDSWVAAAVAQAKRWTNLEMESGLARLSFLWFIGRQGKPDQMQDAIDQSCRWLERKPQHTLVRWGTLWLAGMCQDSDQTLRLIDKTAKWLESGAPDKDRLVRMAYLWTVGAKGTAGQVRRAIAKNAKWLKAHPKDDFIRSAHLLSLIRRSAGPEQRRKAIAETREWLRGHPDIHGLTNIALKLCEAAPE